MTEEALEEIALPKVTVQKKDSNLGRPSITYIEITLPQTLPPSFNLVFQNFYTANILLLQEYSFGGFKPIMEPFRLMQNPFNEAEAQDWHSIPSSSFASRLAKSKPIRIHLFQSASIWNKFEVRNLKIVTRKDSPTVIDANSGSNTTRSMSLSSQIIDDGKILLEASKIQSKLKHFPDLFQIVGGETKKNGKRKKNKDSRKTNTIVMSASLNPDLL